MDIPCVLLCSIVVAGCAGGARSPMPDMPAHAMPDLAVQANPDLGMQTSCDPVAQDCIDATRSKCTTVANAMETAVVAGCVAPTGAKGIGDACVVPSENFPDIGHDDCARGSLCTRLGTFTVTPSRHCRRFCRGHGDCARGERCSPILFMPTYGICLPACELFGAPCPNGLDCSFEQQDIDLRSFFFTCREAGNVPPYSPCGNVLDCQAGTMCGSVQGLPSGACAPLCDGAHPCMLRMCSPLPGVPNGGGQCP